MHRVYTNSRPQIPTIRYGFPIWVRSILCHSWDNTRVKGANKFSWPGPVLDSPTVKGIAEKAKKTSAQVCLRWNLEKGRQLRSL